MNELQIFNNPEFGEVRTTKVTGKGQVYFVNKFLNGSKAVLE